MFVAHRTRPVRLARLATAHHRSRETDRLLGILLAAIAGGVNAGGFLLLSDYTSHMTGHLSQLSGGLVLQNIMTIIESFAVVLSFTLGAAMSSAMIAWGQLHRLRICYALPLGVQGVLLVGLALIEGLPPEIAPRVGLLTVAFVMGLQNATITRISGARIRTSHATGLITDMGIEIGRALYRLVSPRSGVRQDTAKLWLFIQLITAFILGGVAGAVAHGMIGWAFAILPGVLLLVLALSGRATHAPA